MTKPSSTFSKPSKGRLFRTPPLEWDGMAGKIADEINGLIELNAMFSEELKRVSHAVGKKANLSERVGS